MAITISYGSSESSDSSSDSSSEETIYSAQGYETAAICDNVSDDVDSSDDDASSSDRAHNDDYDEANIYRVIFRHLFASFIRRSIQLCLKNVSYDSSC